MQPATNPHTSVNFPSSIYLTQPYAVPCQSSPSSTQVWPQQMPPYHSGSTQMPLGGVPLNWFQQCVLPYPNVVTSQQSLLYSDQNLQRALYAALLYRQSLVNSLLAAPGKENYPAAVPPPHQRGASSVCGVAVDDHEGVEAVEKAIAAQHTNLSASESLAVALLATNLATN